MNLLSFSDKTCWAIPENREMKKMKFSFFHQRHILLKSFDIFSVTYGVTNFLPKLVNIFCRKKLNFHFFEFPYFLVLPTCCSSNRTKQVVPVRDRDIGWHHQLFWRIQIQKAFCQLCVGTQATPRVNTGQLHFCERQESLILHQRDKGILRDLCFFHLNLAELFWWWQWMTLHMPYLRVPKDCIYINTQVQTFNKTPIPPGKQNLEALDSFTDPEKSSAILNQDHFSLPIPFANDTAEWNFWIQVGPA